MFPMFDSVKQWYSELPDKKKWIDFLTASLTVPVLITVIIANINSMRKKGEATPTTSPTPAEIIVKLPENAKNFPQIVNTPTPTAPSISVSPTPVACDLDP